MQPGLEYYRICERTVHFDGYIEVGSAYYSEEPRPAPFLQKNPRATDDEPKRKPAAIIRGRCAACRRRFLMTDLKNARILVTGGAGFIGSALVWALNVRGVSEIVVCDVLDGSEKWRNLAPLRFDDYIAADDVMPCIASGSEPLRGVTHVFHLGACSSTTETDSAYLMRNNYEFTRRLAEWAESIGARFVYASSAATYGALEADLSEGVELRSLRPLNMYAYSKHLFDLFAYRTGMLDRITGVKYFNIFGPNEYHKGSMRSLVHKAFGDIFRTGKVALYKSYRKDYADGLQRRDFLYVKDAVEMTLHLAETESCGLFNIGSGVASTWIDLVTPIFESLQLAPTIEFIEMPDFLRAKYQYYTCANIGRLRSTGYDVTIPPLRDAVFDYVKTYLIPGRNLDPTLDRSPAYAPRQAGTDRNMF